MNEKWQVAVYLMHNNTNTTNEVHRILENSSKTYARKSNTLSNKFLNVDIDENSQKFKKQNLINSDQNEFELFLFYRKHRKSIPEWKSFFNSQVADNEEIRNNPNNMNESFVLFLYHKISKKLYAVCGGYGSFTIQKFIDDDFGINILIRIISNKGEKILKHAKEFGITGGVIGIAKYFRQNYNFYENKNFGNIYREISASLDRTTAQELGITIEETKQCIAKNSFKINHSINFNTMICIVEKLNLIIQRDANFNVNLIKKIDVTKNKTLVENLEKTILNNIWNNKSNLSNINETLDFLHKDFENFLNANSYKFNRNSYSINNLMIEIINNLTTTTKENFLINIKRKKLVSLNNDNEEITSDYVYNHLVSEISYESNSYFLINGDYYLITTDFKDNLNESCKFFINNQFDNGLSKVWNTGRESAYNLLYKGEVNTIVLDTITPENIESCDILKFDSNTTYLYHIKKGFDGSMRDLTNQVYIAANRIIEDKRTTKEYIKSLYRTMQNSETYKNQISSENEFLSLFDNKLCFVIAIKDTASTPRNLNNIEDFNSNIAKFALTELINNMKSLDVEFKITQIN